MIMISSMAYRPSAPHSSAYVSVAALRRRNLRLFLTIYLPIVLIVTTFTALALCITVFKVEDPTMDLDSIDVAGAAPRVSFLPLSVDLNFTLKLNVVVHNPNLYVFEHEQGHAVLRYRSTDVGRASLAGGRLPSKGSENIAVSLTVDIDRMASKFKDLVGDIETGAVPFDAEATIPGKLIILKIIKFKVIAVAECHVVIGMPDMKVKSQECKHKRKLNLDVD